LLGLDWQEYGVVAEAAAAVVGEREENAGPCLVQVQPWLISELRMAWHGRRCVVSVGIGISQSVGVKLDVKGGDMFRVQIEGRDRRRAGI
jgi:hypothetical protein